MDGLRLILQQPVVEVMVPTIEVSWWTTASYDGLAMPDILAAHDFGKVFGFLRARGWSVGAISARTGLDEYRIREIIKGARRIEAHKVIERIAVGLEIDRRLCRIGDFSEADEPAAIMPSPGSAELQEWLAQAGLLDEAALRMLADQTDQIRKVDRGLGAQAADLQLRGHLETLTSLRSFSLLPSNRERLADLFCDAAALAGWVALDLGDVTRAWRYHEAAKDAGRETGSVVALSHALAQQAYVLLDIGNVGQARQLAEYALSVSDRSVPSVLLAWLHAVVGEVCAVAGDEAESRRAFGQASWLLPDDPTDPTLPYIMLDEYHLSRWIGTASARLGDEAAIDQMHFALTGMDSSFVRARAQLHVDLAHSLVAARHEDQALRQLEQARTLATRVGSRRQRRRALELASALQQARS